MTFLFNMAYFFKKTPSHGIQFDLLYDAVASEVPSPDDNNTGRYPSKRKAKMWVFGKFDIVFTI